MWIPENLTGFFLPAVCLELVNLSWDFQQIFAIRRSTHLACPLRLREDLGKSSTGVPKVVCVAVRAGFCFFNSSYTHLATARIWVRFQDHINSDILEPYVVVPVEPFAGFNKS